MSSQTSTSDPSPPTVATASASRTASVVPGKRRTVRMARLQKGVPPFGRLVGPIRQAGRLPCEELLTDEAVVDQIESELDHALSGGALGIDLAGPLQRRLFQLIMGNDGINGAHGMH